MNNGSSGSSNSAPPPVVVPRQRSSFAPLLPSQLRAEQHADARNVTLTGKLMSVRHYSVRGGDAQRTQLVLVGAERDACMQVVVFRSPPPRGNPRAAEALTAYLGRHVTVSPVTLRRRNPTFDSTSAELTGFAYESSMRCNEAGAAVKAAAPQVEALASFVPSLTPLDSARPGTCVNVLAAARGPARAEEKERQDAAGGGSSGTRAVWLAVDDGSSGIGAETVVRIADGGCPTDAYALDAERLLGALKEGDAVLLTDVIADVCVDPPPFLGVASSPCLMLRSWGPTRAWSGFKSPALLEPLRRRLEGAGGPAETRGCSFAEVARALPSCAALDVVNMEGGTTGREQRMCVWGTVDGLAHDRFPYVKQRAATRRPRQGGDPEAVAPPAAIAWATAGEEEEEENKGGGAEAAVAMPQMQEEEEEEETVYDVVTAFSEAPGRGFGFRWTTRAATALMGGSSAEEFGRLDPSAQTTAASDAVGKGVAMRVWVTTDGNAIVTDARVFSHDEAAPFFEAAAAAHRQQQQQQQLQLGNNDSGGIERDAKKPRLMTMMTEKGDGKEGGGCLLDL